MNWDVINDEQPSDDAMDRLWAALDASLDPLPAAVVPSSDRPLGSDRPGVLRCLRCGYKWTPRDPTRPPKGCAFCYSSYWDRPPKTVRARRPEDTDWTAIRAWRRTRTAARTRSRRLARAKEIAAQLGLDITDPRSGRRVAHTRSNAKVLREPLPADMNVLQPAPNPAAERPPVTTTAVHAPWLAMARPRTVPPPPGLDDLEPPNTKG